MFLDTLELRQADFRHAPKAFNPPGVVFPVSAAILEQIDEYRCVLESYSARLLPLVEWGSTGTVQCSCAQRYG